MSDNQGITPPHLQGFGSPSAGATRMTFDERLELTLEMLQLEMLRAGSEEGLLYSQRKRLRHEAITAIKQAMRETMPKRLKRRVPPQPHREEQKAWDMGYNTAIDEIEKGFGL